MERVRKWKTHRYGRFGLSSVRIQCFSQKVYLKRVVERADKSGGGQPTDHGTLTLLDSSSHSIPIKSIQRDSLRCVIHSPEPLIPGTRIRQQIDFTRRWDHMQQHTGQHLLSAIMDTYDNLETLSWGMGLKGEMNYVELPRKPTEEEIVDIQRKCNEIIRNNVKITVETPKDVNGEISDEYDKEKGIVRVIHIGNVDANP
jgi:misacylated tRNA(Ala) deacylase